MIISSQGEACSPNDDIKALDLNGTKALRDRLRQIANSGSGEAALLAGAEMELEQEKQARQALQDFRNYLAQSSDKAARALPSEAELVYNYSPDTQECAITRLDGQDIVLNLIGLNLQGELPLPPQLMVTKLHCSYNQLTALPDLPVSLTRLYCGRNKLTALHDLPVSLTVLNCESNQLTALPDLPVSLTKLYCRYNKLTALPELPTSLIKLWCGNNKLTALPELPASLAQLECPQNKLTALPELPASLTELYCDRNKLTSLPILPANLSEIYCRNNQLTTLPELPAKLFKLDCRDNPSLARKRATKRILKAFIDRGGVVVS